MKKIGVSINDEFYAQIKEISKECYMKPSTICRLIIESRLEYFRTNNYKPKYRRAYFEEVVRKTDEELNELQLQERTRIAKTRWLPQDDEEDDD